MVLTYPLSNDDFWSRLPVSRSTFHAPEAIEMSETDGGDLLTASLGTVLWQGEVTIGKITRDEDADALTLLDHVRQAGRPFCVYDLRRPYPQSDKTGSILDGNTPTLNVSLDRRTLGLSRLPVGYTIQRGDYLSFGYGSGPVRRALHKVVEVSATANALGNTDEFEVVPNVRTGASSGASVELVRPYCTAIIVPGSVNPGTATNALTEGATFQWRQTLRY